MTDYYTDLIARLRKTTKLGWIEPLKYEAADAIEAMVEERDVLRAERDALRKDAKRYRWLRDATGEPADPRAAALWEELITKGCRGSRFDEVVQALRNIGVEHPRFANVSCSQCGRDFGPGDNGYSHCKDHAALTRTDQAAARHGTLGRSPPTT